jgi:hypothetical protein
VADKESSTLSRPVITLSYLTLPPPGLHPLYLFSLPILPCPTYIVLCRTEGEEETSLSTLKQLRLPPPALPLNPDLDPAPVHSSLQPGTSSQCDGYSTHLSISIYLSEPQSIT